MSQVLLDEVCDFFNGGAWSDKEYVTKGMGNRAGENVGNTGIWISNSNQNSGRKFWKSRNSAKNVYEMVGL